jgi:hypothetical protein
MTLRRVEGARFALEHDILDAGNLEHLEAQRVLVGRVPAPDVEVDAIPVALVVLGVAAAGDAVVVGHQQ